jgi:hypothetical protein
VTGGDRAGKFFADFAASVPAGLSRRSFHRSRPRDPAAVVAFLDRHDVRLAARVKRKVGNKLRTRRKSG